MGSEIFGEPTCWKVTWGEWDNVDKLVSSNTLKPSRIIFNNKSTICYFPDGDKVVVTCHEGEAYEKEVGVMACIMKKLYGTRAEFLRTVHNGYVQPQPQKKQEKLDLDKSQWVKGYDPIKDS
jgi:hypothetical protein